MLVETLGGAARGRGRPGGHDSLRGRAAARQAWLLRLVTPRTVFMELGAGDCALSLSVAGYAERVYSVESSQEAVAGLRAPTNLRRIVSDAPGLPIEDGAVHLAYSGKPLHREQVREVCRTLAPGGVYFCGAGASPAARLRREFLDSGFPAVRLYAAARGRLLRAPFAVAPLLGRIFTNGLHVAGIK